MILSLAWFVPAEARPCMCPSTGGGNNLGVRGPPAPPATSPMYVSHVRPDKGAWGAEKPQPPTPAPAATFADVPRPDKGTWAREEAAASCMRQAQQQPHSCLCPTAGQGSLSARTSHGLFRVSGGGNLAYVHIPTAG